MNRLLHSSATLSLVLLIGFLVITSQWVSHSLGARQLQEVIERSEIERINTVAAIVDSLQLELREEAQTTARILVGDQSILAAMQKSGTQGTNLLASRLDGVFELHAVQLLEVVDAKEALLYRAKTVQDVGDATSDWGVAEVLEQGRAIVTSRHQGDSVTIQAIEPLKVGGEILGALTVGMSIDKKFVSKIGKQIQADVGLLGRDGLIVGDFGATTNYASASTAFDMTGVSDAFQSKIPVYRVDNTRHVTSVYVPVVIVDEAYVLLVRLDSGEAFRVLDAGRDRSVWIATLIFCVSLLIGFLALRYLLRPLRDLSSRALQLGLEPTGESITVSGSNEVRVVVSVLDTLTQRLLQRNQELRDESEKAQAANLAKTQFLATMSHEIRTPLNGVLGMAELLRGTRLDETQASFVNAIGLAGKSLHGLLSDILDLAKIEEGQITLEIIDFDLISACEDAAAMVREIAGTKKLILEADFSELNCRWARGDLTRLRQVLGNLLSNAIKFTEQGTVTFRAQSLDTPGDDDRLWCRFTITDTGIGMDEAAQAKIFQRFAQADSSMTRRYGGSGLGLVICKNLIASMGGQIHVRSAAGQGSSFWFDLPFYGALRAPKVDCKPEAQPVDLVAVPVVPEVPEVPEVSSLRVLVVEDNMINQMFLRTLLQRRGFSVTVADNGQIGLQAAQSQTFDLVFMDCQMPVMDGFEATRQIRAWEETQPGRPPVPIIALTANVQESDRDACFAAGMTEFATKPIKGEQIDLILANYGL